MPQVHRRKKKKKKKSDNSNVRPTASQFHRTLRQIENLPKQLRFETETQRDSFQGIVRLVQLGRFSHMEMRHLELVRKVLAFNKKRKSA
jgi:hypothetical protein